MADITVKKDEIEKSGFWASTWEGTKNFGRGVGETTVNIGGFLADGESWKAMGSSAAEIFHSKNEAGNGEWGQAAVNAAALAGMAADGVVDIYRAGREKITGEAFVASDIADKARQVSVTRLPSLTGQALENLVASIPGVIAGAGGLIVDSGQTLLTDAKWSDVHHTGNWFKGTSDGVKSAGRFLYGTPVAPQNENEAAMLTSLDVATVAIPVGQIGKIAPVAKGIGSFLSQGVARFEGILNPSVARSFVRIDPVIQAESAAKTVVTGAETAAKTTTQAATKLEPVQLNPSAPKFGAGKGPNGERVYSPEAQQYLNAQKAASDSVEWVAPTLTAEQKAFQAELAAQRAAREAGTARPAAETAEATAGLRGAKAAADTAKAADTSTIGWWQAFRMRSTLPLIRTDANLATKLEALNAAGRTDDAAIVLAKARMRGITGDEVREIAQSVERNKLSADVLSVAEKSNKAANRIISPTELIASRASYFRADPLMATLRTPVDLLMIPARFVGAQVRAVTSIAPVMKANPLTSAAVVGGGTVAAVSAHNATGGASTDAVASAARKLVDLDINIAKTYGTAGITAVTAAVGLVSADTAKKLGQDALEVGENTAKGAPGVASRFFSTAFGITPENAAQWSNDHPWLSMALPSSVKFPLSANQTVQNTRSGRTEEALERAEQRVEQILGTGTPTQAPAGAESPHTLRERAQQLAGTAKAKKEEWEDALEGYDPTDVEGSWSKLKIAAAKMPGGGMLKKVMEAGDDNPLMKWGVILGFGSGMLGGGSPTERMMAGVKQAVIIGAMMDIIGGLFGYRSRIGEGLSKVMGNLNGSTNHGPAGIEGYVARYREPSTGLLVSSSQPAVTADNAKLVDQYVKGLETGAGGKPLFNNDAERTAYTQQVADYFNHQSPERLAQMKTDAENGVITMGLSDRPPVPQSLQNKDNLTIEMVAQGDRLSAARKLDDQADVDQSKVAFNTINNVVPPMSQVDHPNRLAANGLIVRNYDGGFEEEKKQQYKSQPLLSSPSFAYS